MSRIKKRALKVEDLVEFFNYVVEEKPLLPVLIPLVLLVWGVERWVFSFSSWVPLAVAVWATLQYGNYQRRIVVEDLNRQWKRVILNTSPITPLEPCEWLNKLLMEVWPNYINPKLSLRFSSIVEKRLKHRKSRLIERIDLREFSLGSSPPSLGLHGTRWSTSGDQRIMRLGFDWDTTDMSILLLAKLAKPLIGTARIVINSLHIKGDVKILTETLVKTMVEPRRRCYSMPAVSLRKKAVGGIIYVTVVSASKLSWNGLRLSPSRRQLDRTSEEHLADKDL